MRTPSLNDQTLDWVRKTLDFWETSDELMLKTFFNLCRNHRYVTAAKYGVHICRTGGSPGHRHRTWRPMELDS